MNVKLHCPFCGQKYELAEYTEGTEVECGKCMRTFKLEKQLFAPDSAALAWHDRIRGGSYQYRS